MVVGLGVSVLAGCSSSPGETSSAPNGPTIPLTSSSVTGTAAWATLAMGHLDDPLNTFWQLLRLDGSTWKLATPPGVASNGGLVATAAPTSVVAAFGPSQYLKFSPLARTSDQSSSWQAGVLPAGVSSVPDALAQSGDKLVALLATAGGSVVSANAAALSTWTPVTTASAIRETSGNTACHVRSLTAVTLEADGSTLVGASCAQGDRAGVFALSSGAWMPVGPAIPGEAGASTDVIRLDQTASGTAALVSAGSGSTIRLYGMWSAGGLGPWTISGGLSLGGASLRSTAVSAAGGFVVTTRSGGTPPSAWALDPSGSHWKSLPSLPAGTTSVTAVPAGSYDALVPTGSTLSVFGLGGTRWVRIQRLQVDIPYGSSG